MGSSLKIQDTNLDITKFSCSQCSQSFTLQDKANDNWDLWWDTSNEAKIDEIWPNNNGFTLSIWIRDITHKFWVPENSPRGYYECPELLRCEECRQIIPTGNLCANCQKETKHA